MKTIRLYATDIEEGMEVETPNGSVLIERVTKITGRPYVEFEVRNGRKYRVPHQERFTILS